MNSADEIFTNPPLHEVAFEVRFPHLFYINQRIGEFQLEIMDDFPKSSQIFEHAFAIDEKGIAVKDNENPIPSWHFENESGKTKITIHSNKLNIISNEYKSYNHPSEKNFRGVIEKIVKLFIKQVPIKNFTRLGIRYIDHCPLEKLENEYFENFYTPLFDIDRYKLEDILENRMLFRVRKNDYQLLFQSAIREIDDSYKYIIDFDGYAINVEANNFINVTDDLKRLIKKEFLSNITENFKEYMRRTNE